MLRSPSLSSCKPNQATTRVLRRWQETDATLPITLLQALPKGDKFDLILQKGTELGVSCFQPIETAHAVPNLNAARLSSREQRWQRIVSEAARQSRRTFLPEVKPLQTLADGPRRTIQRPQAGALGRRCRAAWRKPCPQAPPAGVRLLIGPEGGFSSAEIDAITAGRVPGRSSGPANSAHGNCGLGSDPHFAVSLWRLAVPPCWQQTKSARGEPMKCPKCGYHSFDHLDSCKKCGHGLAEHKAKFNLRGLLCPRTYCCSRAGTGRS